MLRELRVESRKAVNYRLRSVVAGAGTLFMGMLLSQRSSANSGIEFFDLFHRMMMGVILVIGPVLTSDTLSRERREGTLPLLFLAPLTGFKLVSTKYGVQFMRALGFWLVLIPIGTVPLLAGGVPPAVIVTALGVQFSALLLSLGAGMIFSAFGRRFMVVAAGSIAGALVLWVADLVLLVGGYLLIHGTAITGPFVLPMVDFMLRPRDWARGGLLADPVWFACLGGNLVMVLLAGGMIFRWLGRQVSRKENAEMETAREAWFRRVFLTPKFLKEQFHRSMRSRMAVNPLIWLEYRRAWSRAGRWALLAGLIVYESFVISYGGSRPIWNSQMVCLWVLLLVMCFSASSSFQNERETGAFELMLVAPFTEWRLLQGRLRAVWSYYWPAMVTAAIVIPGLHTMTYLRWTSGSSFDERTPLRILSLILSFVTVPAAGLYFSLRLKQFLPVLVLTVLFGLVLPGYLGEIVQGVVEVLTDEGGWMTSFAGFVVWNLGTRWEVVVGLHLLLNCFFFVEILERLKQRTFAI